MVAEGEFNMNKRTQKTRELVGLSIFAALVVVLQLVATFVKFGPFSITLALTPIVVGAALYGKKSGAALGGIFGFVVLLMCITGADVGGAILWNINPIMTAILCLGKGAAAGFMAGVFYKIFEKKSVTCAVVAAAIISPITNTGLFVLGMATVFQDTLIAWAGGADVVYYVFMGLVGVNFLVELITNAILSPIITRIITMRKKGTV